MTLLNHYRTFVGLLLNMYRTSYHFQLLSNIYQWSTKHVLNIYCNIWTTIKSLSNIYCTTITSLMILSIVPLSNYCWTSIKHLSNIYRTSIGLMLNIYRTSIAHNINRIVIESLCIFIDQFLIIEKMKWNILMLTVYFLYKKNFFSVVTTR